MMTRVHVEGKYRHSHIGKMKYRRIHRRKSMYRRSCHTKRKARDLHQNKLLEMETEIMEEAIVLKSAKQVRSMDKEMAAMPIEACREGNETRTDLIRLVSMATMMTARMKEMVKNTMMKTIM